MDLIRTAKTIFNKAVGIIFDLKVAHRIKNVEIMFNRSNLKTLYMEDNQQRSLKILGFKIADLIKTVKIKFKKQVKILELNVVDLFKKVKIVFNKEVLKY